MRRLNSLAWVLLCLQVAPLGARANPEADPIAQVEMTEIRKELGKLSSEYAACEARARDIEATLQSLEEEQGYKALSLVQKRTILENNMAAFQKIARQNQNAFTLAPQSMHELVQTSIVLRSLMRQLNQMNLALEQGVWEMSLLRTMIEKEKKSLDQVAVLLDEKRQVLMRLIARRQQYEEKMVAAEQLAEQKRMEILAAQSASLKDLLGKMEAARAAEPPVLLPIVVEQQRKQPEKAALPERIRPSATPENIKGTLKLPVQGEVVQRFAKAKTGITLKTRPGAQVTAPLNGRIAFVGPFRGYKEITLIEHDNGFYTLLTGLNQAYVSPGQVLEAGELIGFMPEKSPAPELYLEMRHHSTLIDPEPWYEKGSFEGP